MPGDLSTKPKIAVAQLGARRHYAIPRFLHQAGYLDCFYTDLCASAWWLRVLEAIVPNRIQPNGLRRLLARSPQDVPPERIRCFSWFALQRVLRRDRTTTPGELLRAQLRSNRQFCRLLASYGVGHANVLYVFNGAGLELMQASKQRGMTCIVEQTSAAVDYDQRLLAQERERWPGWEPEAMTPSDWAESAQRERDEWDLADAIFCGSQYVVDSVAAEAGPADRCTVVPYGIQGNSFPNEPRRPHDRPLRLLFVGAMQLRKGVPYLLHAVRKVRNSGIICRVVGDNLLSSAIEPDLREGLELIGRVPRNEIQAHYAWADILVLPSISEGSANVCYEAMASGLPVITTANAGSVVRDGGEGFIVPIRSAEAIVEAVEKLDQDRELLANFSAAAVARAREYDWHHYAQRLVAAVNSVTRVQNGARNPQLVG